ncbi:MAG: hypothetical protein IT364_21615 [Candidatus Hydrogenedentes bacterium]|nr:hypothetical protein [Candidatus Hydrogenedentota bacterium]
MTRTTLRRESLPMKAQLSDFFNFVEIAGEILTYFRAELYRIFFFFIDLMTLFAGL